MVQLDSNLTDGTTGQVSSRPGPLHLLHPDVIPPNAKIPMVGLRDWRNNFCCGPAQASLQEVRFMMGVSEGTAVPCYAGSCS